MWLGNFNWNRFTLKFDDHHIESSRGRGETMQDWHLVFTQYRESQLLQNFIMFSCLDFPLALTHWEERAWVPHSFRTSPQDQWPMLGISLPFWFLGGVNIRGAGEGKLLAQGEIGEGEYSRRSELLRISFSGDSISLSLILMSDLYLLCQRRKGSCWVSLSVNLQCSLQALSTGWSNLA